MSKIIAGEDMVIGTLVELGGDTFVDDDGEITGIVFPYSKRTPRPLGAITGDVKEGEIVELWTKCEGAFRVDKLPGLDLPCVTAGLPQPPDWPRGDTVPRSTFLEVVDFMRRRSVPLTGDDDED